MTDKTDKMADMARELLIGLGGGARVPPPTASPELAQMAQKLAAALREARRQMALRQADFGQCRNQRWAYLQMAIDEADATLVAHEALLAREAKP